MKQALIFTEEIIRKIEAVQKSTSPKFKRDYNKSIARDKAELRQYCRLRGINYKALDKLIAYYTIEIIRNEGWIQPEIFKKDFIIKKGE